MSIRMVVLSVVSSLLLVPVARGGEVRPVTTDLRDLYCIAENSHLPCDGYVGHPATVVLNSRGDIEGLDIVLANPWKELPLGVVLPAKSFAQAYRHWDMTLLLVAITFLELAGIEEGEQRVALAEELEMFFNLSQSVRPVPLERNWVHGNHRMVFRVSDKEEISISVR